MKKSLYIQEFERKLSVFKKTCNYEKDIEYFIEQLPKYISQKQKNRIRDRLERDYIFILGINQSMRSMLETLKE